MQPWNWPYAAHCLAVDAQSAAAMTAAVARISFLPVFPRLGPLVQICLSEVFIADSLVTCLRRTQPCM